MTFDVATRTNQRTAGTYTIGASDYSTDGSGTGATFSVVVDGSGNGTYGFLRVLVRDML